MVVIIAIILFAGIPRIYNIIFGLHSEQLKGLSGRYTDANIAQNSKLVGQLRDSLQNISSDEIAEKSIYYKNKKVRKKDCNVKDLLHVLLPEHLLKYSYG